MSQTLRTTPLPRRWVETILESTLRAFPGSNDQSIGSGIVDTNAAASPAATH